MTSTSHRTELAENGYEKIETKIQTIENLAQNGIFSAESRNSRFYQIVLEIKKLRQVLREVLLIVPNTICKNAEGDAA